MWGIFLRPQSVLFILLFIFLSFSQADNNCLVQLSSAKIACEADPGSGTCASNKNYCIQSCQGSEWREELSICQNIVSSGTDALRSSQVDSEQQCLSQGPHTPETAAQCVALCTEALATTTKKAQVQSTLAQCEQLVAKADPAPRDVRNAGTPDKPAGDKPPKDPKPPEEKPVAQTPPPAKTDTPAGGDNPFGAMVSQGLAATSSPDANVSAPPSNVNFSGGPTADPSGFRTASEAVSAGGGGFQGVGSLDNNRPFEPSEYGGRRSENNNSGGAAPAPAVAGGGAPMGGGGGSSGGGSRKGGGGAPGGSALRPIVDRVGQNSFYGAGGSMIPAAPKTSSTKAPLPTKYVKKTDESSQALTRLFGGKSSGPQKSSRLSGFIPAGGMSCLNTVFCNMETFFGDPERSPSSEFMDSAR